MVFFARDEASQHIPKAKHLTLKLDEALSNRLETDMKLNKMLYLEHIERLRKIEFLDFAKISK